MAATTVSSLVNRTRRFIRDWPDEDVLAASVTSSAATITVADATEYQDNWAVEIDNEVLVVTSTASSGTTVTVRRGARGSTAASHASGAVILKKPAFFNLEFLDAFNAALEAMYPYIYRPVVDESLTTVANQYEYSIPVMPASDTDANIYHISKISIQMNTGEAFYPEHAWDVIRGSSTSLANTASIVFRRATPDSTSTIRLYGFGPFPRLTLAGSLDNLFPRQAEELLVLYAASHLLASGEAGRVRQDRGVRDTREEANVAGSSMRASQALLQRFYARLGQASMPPMPKNVKSVV